jgi:hypothetical protein
MKAFVCLAISCLLIGLLYVYVRQQFAAQNNQIGELSRFIRGMAAEVTPKELTVVKEDYLEKEEKQELIEVSDDSESDSDSDSESDDEGANIRTFDLENVKVEKLDETIPDLLEPLDVLEPEIIEVVEETAKKIVLETNYEQWSLKELKEKITQMGGPNLKTKKLMIEYLEKKV